MMDNKIFDYTILEQVTKDLSKPFIMNKYYQPYDDKGQPIEGLASEEYSINGFVTNPDIQKNSTRNLHSLDLFRSGDVFQLDNNNYYIVTDNILEKRGAKYKGVARYCNVELPVNIERKVVIDYESNGRPIYATIKTLVGYARGYAEYSRYGINNGAIVTADNQLEITLRDNEANRKEFILNYVAVINTQKWKVMGIDYSRSGLMTLRANSTL